MPSYSLKNKTFLITCGPTWVPIDDTRVISNRSTGLLGQTIACNLAKAGAKVTLLEGPVTKPLEEKNIRIIKYQFFNELFKIIKKECKKKYHVIIHAAAISDYQLNTVFSKKIRSDKHKFKLELKPTPKIIESIKTIAPESCLIGFKLESKLSKNDLRRIAKSMHKKSQCDFILANTQNTKTYKGYILNPEGKVLAQQNTRAKIARSLQTILGHHS